MDVGGTPGLALLEQHHIAHRPVHGNGIARRQDGAEGEAPVRIRMELSAQVVLGLIGILIFIHACRGGVPHIDLDARHRLARRVDHAATREERRARGGRAQQGAAIGGLGAAHAPEGAEQGGGGLGGAVRAIVHQADEGGDADGVGEEHALVMGVGGLLTDAVQEIDAIFPFLLGQLHLTHEGVHVLDEGLADFADARIGRAGHGLQDGGRDVIFVIDDHGAFLVLEVGGLSGMGLRGSRRGTRNPWGLFPPSMAR